MITSLLATFAIVIILTALATFVAVRAGAGLPARLFVAVTATLVVMNVCNLARFLVTDPLTGMLLAAPSLLALTLLEGLLLLLLSALFMPQWWAGTRPIRWIALPYFLVLLVLGGDIGADTGWFVGSITRSDTGFYRFAPAQPGASVLLGLSFVGWLVQLALLLVAFAWKPPTRPAISLLFGAIVIGIVAPMLISTLPIPYLSHLPHVLVSLPLLAALAYAVLRTRLVIPTPAALNLAIQALPDPLVVLDTRQRVVYTNPAAEALRLLPGHLSNELAACVAQADCSDDAVRVVLDGRQVMMHSTAVINLYGEQIGLLLLGRDVTELEQRTAELHASERLLQTLIDHLPASVLVKDQRQRYMLVNTAYEQMLPAYTRADVIGRTDAEVMGRLHTNEHIISSEHLPLLQQLVAQWQQEDTEVVATGRSFQQEARLPIGEHTRTYLTNKFPLFDKQDAITGIGVIAIDITERKQMELALHEQATRDGLTGLYNRRYLDEMLPRELHQAASYRRPVGLIMLDIDHFKRCNDMYGHDAGDTLLRAVSTFLQVHTRDGDLVCRYGGEEFTLVLPGASLAATQQRAEQIRAGIEALAVAYGGHLPLQVTVSLGVAAFPDHGTTADDLIRAADQALYQAKHSGRNRVVLASEGRGFATSITNSSNA
jgi:diguanylate cyclase (GGDEF)-like protein/PAS domain S-box-containing protein